ncbi:Shugoshin, C-terminal [Parasponia andersonii]|uniref:Shugoshin, C-terminal n=1 Tax=Parasponia andersonii TaxID=3476 RepID=A0A2P5CZN3_PARAD|nr:Shugoshin, C-terminal [Parasponia andersonii]
MALIKLVAERNKIIELTGAELQKLRVGLQKLQLQNWNLAQSNSKMLAELNLGRERVKALQHELSCKDALLKTKKLGQEGEKAKRNCQNTCSQEGDEADLDIDGTEEKPRNHNRRRAPRCRCKLFIFTLLTFYFIANYIRRLRRQSASFKSHEKEPTENLFEIEDAKFPASQAFDKLRHSTLEEEKEENCIWRSAAVIGSQRSSIGRPLRKAAGKVHSYREVPINVKMRRKE